MSSLGSLLGALGGGGEIGRAVVDLQLRTEQFKSQLVGAEAETKAASEEMSAETKAASSSMVTALAAAGAAAVVVGVLSVKAAIEQKEAQDKLANSIANSSKVSFSSVDAFNAQAESIGLLTGVQDDAITSAQAMGIQFGLTARQITELTPLVVDLAVKNGVNLTTAMSAVGKAVNGNSGALARLKLNVDKAAFASDHYGATVDALTRGVKGYAEQIAKDEPWKVLIENVHQTEEAIGKHLLPTLVKFSGILASISEGQLPKASDAVGVFANVIQASNPMTFTFAQSMQQAGSDVEGFQQQVDTLNQSVMNGTVTASEAVTQVRALAEAHGFDEEAVNQLAAAEEKGTAAMAKQQAQVKELGKSIHNFAGLSTADFARFKQDAATSMSFVEAKFGDLESKAHITATQLVNAFDKALNAQKDFAHNSDRFLTEVAERLGPGLQTAAQQMVAELAKAGPKGAALIQALADANAQQQRRIVADWRRSQDAAHAYANELTNIPSNITTNIHFIPHGRGPAVLGP